MLSFLTMLFTFRLGLGAGPVDGAVASLRQESLTVASRTARADTPPAVPTAIEQHWEPPARRQLTDRDWKQLLAGALQNETLANAAMWVATQPLRVSVGHEKVFVTIRVATP